MIARPVAVGRPRSSARVRLGVIAVLLLVALGAEACSIASPTASPGPTTASFSPSGGVAIEHASGPTDVVFRFEEGGGFVPIDFLATQAPQLTLYGDGTVIFRDLSLPAPTPPRPNVIVLTPFQTVRLDEAALQAFLRFALADSGLGVARASYRPGNVADAPTAIFTIHAGGVNKTVSVEALGFDSAQSPDAPILHALAALGDRVRAFGSSVAGETPWIPTRWRGVLAEGSATGAVAWPWTEIAPTDFVQHAGVDAPRFRIRTMTPAEVAVLGLAGIEGGMSGLSLSGPDGTAYSFALRPLLPNEGF
jgi:hypothetical protein